jgi:hypothetical protein
MGKGGEKESRERAKHTDVKTPHASSSTLRCIHSFAHPPVHVRRRKSTHKPFLLEARTGNTETNNKALTVGRGTNCLPSLPAVDCLRHSLYVLVFGKHMPRPAPILGTGRAGEAWCE